MQIVILTIGNELLAGDIESTDATWLAQRLTEGGATVARIQMVPDDYEVIAETVTDWAAAFDAVLVTGGLGGTPDDITMEAVATGLDRAFVVSEETATQAESTIAAALERRPDIDFDLEPEWYASMPADAKVLPNEEGLTPDCRAGNVYVLPGIPDEMKPMFEGIAERFAGGVESWECYADTPKGAVVYELGAVAERSGVGVGNYPNSGGPTRVKLTGGDPAVLDGAMAWSRSNATADLYESEAAIETAREAEAGGEKRSQIGRDGGRLGSRDGE